MAQPPFGPGFGPQNVDPLAAVHQQLGLLSKEVGRIAQRLYAMEVAETVRAAGRTPRRRIEFRSQSGEDAMAWQLFDQQLDGFYIEVGAFDGVSFSATYAFDCIGWNGLLVEAIPERYEQCVRNRPSARVVHAALGGPGSAGTATFHVTPDPLGGMFSHLEGYNDPRSAGYQARTLSVPFTTMDELLKDHAGEVDLAVIDVEGAEVPLLQGFDLRRHRPKVMIIEDNTREPTSPLARYMATMPYAEVGGLQWFNRVYIRQDLAAEWGARLRRG